MIVHTFIVFVSMIHHVAYEDWSRLFFESLPEEHRDEEMLRELNRLTSGGKGEGGKKKK